MLIATQKKLKIITNEFTKTPEEDTVGYKDAIKTVVDEMRILLKDKKMAKNLRKSELFRPHIGSGYNKPISLFLEKLTVQILGDNIDEAKRIIRHNFTTYANSSGSNIAEQLEALMERGREQITAELNLPNVPTHNITGGKRRKSRRKQRRSSSKTLRKNKRVSRKRNISRRRRSRKKRTIVH